MHRVRTSLAGALALIGAGATAQVSPEAFSNPEARTLVQRATALAGSDMQRDAADLCRLPVRRPPGNPPEQATVRQFPPVKVFDDVYFMGSTYVGATVVKTSAGLVLIDTLTDNDAAEHQLLAGMKALGLDPAKIRYVILTHGHGDHYGGISFLRARYPGFRVVASEDDWDFMAKPSRMPDGSIDPSPKEPRRADDIGYKGSFRLKVGDKTFTLVETPGHTPGTTSLIYPVKVKGRSHVVMQWGGGSPGDPRFSAATVETFAKAAKAAGADVRWGSHGRADWTTLAPQIVADPRQAQRLVIGKPAVSRYLDMAVMCKQAAAIESGK